MTSTRRGRNRGHRPPPAASPRPPLGHVVRLSEVAPHHVPWLSPGRLALGKITVLDGDPGLGKSTLLCDWAARISRGQPLPGGRPAPPRGVILLAAEDDPYDTIRPRIDAAGGDPGRVVTMNSMPTRDGAHRPFVIPGDAPFLVDIAAHVDAALVIVDPLAGFLEGGAANSATQARRAMAALQDIAQRANIAVIVVRHLNKSAGVNPLYRGAGSIGLIGAARCALLLSRDPKRPERRILAVAKGNLTSQPPSLAFHLEDRHRSGVVRVVWDGQSRWTASQLLHAAAESAAMPAALTEAREWLRAALANHPRPSKSLQLEAAAHGHSLRTLARARRAERIVVRKAPGRDGHWTWELPSPAGSLPTPRRTN